MEFAQLEAFLAVARHHSFGQAAAELGLTQPALSISIRKLETTLEVSLFDRFRRDVRLTDAGRLFHDYAQRIINLRNQARVAIEELQQVQFGKVTIGANESTNLYLLPKIILKFRERYPNIKIEVFRSSSVELPQEVKERNLDFGIIAFDAEDRELESYPILQDELVLILPPDHPLAKKKKVTFRDLAKETFVAHNVNSPSRDHVVDAFRKHHALLNIAIELSSLETIKQFVQRKVGIAFLPRLAVAEELAQGKFISMPIEGFQHRRTLSAISLRDKVHSHAAVKFLDTMKSFATR